MMRLVFLFLLLLAAPATAEVTYTITLTDERAEILADQTRAMNTARAGLKKAEAIPPLTPAQVLQIHVNSMLDHADEVITAGDSAKPWADKRARVKRRQCAALKLDPCPK